MLPIDFFGFIVMCVTEADKWINMRSMYSPSSFYFNPLSAETSSHVDDSRYSIPLHHLPQVTRLCFVVYCMIPDAVRHTPSSFTTVVGMSVFCFATSEAQTSRVIHHVTVCHSIAYLMTMHTILKTKIVNE